MQSPSVTKINTKTGYDEETDRTTNAPPWRYNITFSSFRALSCAGDHSVPSFKIQYAGIAMDSTPAFAAYSPTIPTISPLSNSGTHTNRALYDFNSFCGTSSARSRLVRIPTLKGNSANFRTIRVMIVRRRVQVFLGLLGRQE